MEQKKINESSAKIASMILKFSTRLNYINKQVRELQRLNPSSPLKFSDQKSILNRTSQLDDSISSLADECALMLNNMTVVVEQPFISTIDNDESEKTRMDRQAKLHKLMTVC